MKQRKKVIIVNFGSTGNSGSFALLIGQIRALQAIGIRLTDITVAAFEDKERVREETGVKVIDIPGGSRVKSAKKIVLLASAFLYFLLQKIGFSSHFLLPREARRLKKFSLALNTGGDNLTGSYSFGGVLCHLANLYLLYFLGVPLVFFGESIGGFDNRILGWLVKWLLQRSSAFFAREKETIRELKKMGVWDKRKVFLIADPAFLLEPVSQKKAKKLLKQEKVPDNFIGLSLSAIIHRYCPEGTLSEKKEFILSLFARLVDWLVEKKKKKVVLISHVYTKGDDDRLVNRELLKRVKHKDKVFVLLKKYSPAEVKSIIGLSELFAGCRMHSLIAAVSQGVPVLAVAYSHKTWGIIGGFMQQKSFVVDVRQGLNEVDLEKKISQILSQKEKIRQNLLQKSATAQSLILKGAREMQKILGW
ncbi:polysaccharide pyruvyl transferase family protein [bacterium]|nr:polysaccharide pyruvyl transferase family protein [bacterium]